MERKSAAGSIRNKERSKKKFLDAVGEILKTKGYAALKINDIAATAGVDKKMIYTYFGGMDGLMDEYIRSQDYWSKMTPGDTAPNFDDHGRAFAKELLLAQYDYVHKNKEAQKLLLWRLSEPRKSLKKMTDTQEENGEALFKFVADPFFGERAKEYRAIMSILVSGLYYLNMYASLNGSIFCGIDLNTPEGRDTVKKAISFLVDQTYDNLNTKQE
ncbi:TetR/AcrR family transcriptional regulator [Chryseobacterium gallinarum]|uniref:TetR family transcriptional regulator n=1 Tax=Chryseobacterium gallinarum TaxID=1324352 RepID=A0A0G3M5Y0_CHRGL|nr:TetR/AcrR family transcriptional regulator [Chryseobacterium gallinarum]AKK74536.1 TetR family transcriptional regulator [Chryseobacterium gallinarum]MCL8538373.1 TetR/AcrR family transcriptional regulator [Chryseobacterium gallinarum]QIY89661.1 TetR/AcrR family transcriptional regulator [Chryseobacterium gallinarum]